MTGNSKPYQSGDYDEIFTASSTGNLTNEEAVAYSQSYYKELDNQSAIRFAEKRGIEIGEKKGIEIGEKKSIEIGEKKGRQEGRQKTLTETAQKARELGLSEDMISKIFGDDKNS